MDRRHDLGYAEHKDEVEEELDETGAAILFYEKPLRCEAPR